MVISYEEKGDQVIAYDDGKELGTFKLLAKGKTAASMAMESIGISAKYYCENTKTGERFFVW